jgi:uncharacterized protein (DUF488 family)
MIVLRMPTIWTIGHSTRSLGDFIATLQAHGVQGIADVRKLPGSRRYPHFDQAALSTSLHEHGICYHHFPGLGGRRKPDAHSHNTAWRHPAFRAYADYMETPEFAEAMRGLARFAEETPVALMCAEAVWWRCHRGLIADYLKVRGWRVLHITDARSAKEHPYTGAASVRAGELSYEDPA